MMRWMWIVGVLCAAMAAQEGTVKPAPDAAKKDMQAATAAAAPKKTMFMPEEVIWGPAPPFVEPGAQFVVLEGDPGGAEGDYTVRVKMPGGYKIAPRWHPKQENVTVLSGTLKVGMGDKLDDSEMTSFAAGSFAGVAPDMHHYAMADGETTIQIHGMAPFSIVYVDPKDDPRNRDVPAMK